MHRISFGGGGYHLSCLVFSYFLVCGLVSDIYLGEIFSYYCFEYFFCSHSSPDIYIMHMLQLLYNYTFYICPTVIG